MKRIFIAVGLLLLAGLSACAYEPAAFVYDDNFVAPRSHWQGLRMYVAADSITSTGLRLSMVNESEIIFGHGTVFHIQHYSAGVWRQVPFINEAFWTWPILKVNSNSTVDENISWEHMHGQLPPGKYRVVRSFMERNQSGTSWAQAWNRGEARLHAIFIVEGDYY